MGPAEIMIRGHLTAQGFSRTRQLALRLRITAATARRILAKLERQGVVERDPRYSAVNDICWRLKGRATGEAG